MTLAGVYFAIAIIVGVPGLIFVLKNKDVIFPKHEKK